MKLMGGLGQELSSEPLRRRFMGQAMLFARPTAHPRSVKCRRTSRSWTNGIRSILQTGPLYLDWASKKTLSPHKTIYSNQWQMKEEIKTGRSITNCQNRRPSRLLNGGKPQQVDWWSCCCQYWLLIKCRIFKSDGTSAETAETILLLF